ncbi:MAG: M23 family metallopeptidase [Thermodesulfobacteriota bacterium]
MGLLNSNRRARGDGGLKRLVVILLAIIIVASVGLLVYVMEREEPTIAAPEVPELFGAETTMALQVMDGRSGLREVRVELSQGQRQVNVFLKKFPRATWVGRAGLDQLMAEVVIDAKKLGLADGPAQLTISARDFSLWGFGGGNRAELTVPLKFDTVPPALSRLDSPSYIKQGGTGMVIYRLSEEVARHGVMLNGFFHPGFPLSEKKKGSYGAIVALPYDAKKIEAVAIVAEDQAGNEARSPFGMIVKNGNFKKDTINVPKSFLDLKMPEFRQYYPDLTGDTVEQYVQVNNEVRTANNAKIREVCSTSMPEKHWYGRFQRMAGAGRASFADHRTYRHNGRKIDFQVHLGQDIASVRHAPVKAANGGKVAYTGYLGIYGNMVIVDHGTGVFSLYSHLSQISVAVDDMVDKGAVLGATGTTGMAGGDHLHFSMLVNGVFVNPLEWWDGSWLALHIESYFN